MQIRPIIPEAYLDRSKAVTEAIPGNIYAWEPDLEHARELIIVIKVEGDIVYSRNLHRNGPIVPNTIDRFLEAVVHTTFRPWSIEDIMRKRYPIKLRSDSAQCFINADLVLQEDEIVFVRDLQRFFVGDGKRKFTELEPLTHQELHNYIVKHEGLVMYV